MSVPSKFSQFINSQVTFFKYLKTNFFKPFSLESMVEEQDKEYKEKTAMLKKASMESIAKMKLIADLQYAQHQIHDRTKELDYLYQRREANRKKQLEAMEELLSTIELDDDGYIIKKDSANNISPSQQKLQNENILNKLHQKQQLQQSQSPKTTANASIDDLDSMFDKNSTTTTNNNKKDKEYINVKDFDFNSIFKEPTKFSEEEYLKEKQLHQKLQQEQQKK